MTMSAAERSLRASLAADASWAATPTAEARTARAMRGVDARLRRYEEQVTDPDGVLTDDERREAARLLMRADMKRLRLKQMRAANAA
jgi:hypothetical protein